MKNDELHRNEEPAKEFSSFLMGVFWRGFFDDEGFTDQPYPDLCEGDDRFNKGNHRGFDGPILSDRSPMNANDGLVPLPGSVRLLRV